MADITPDMIKELREKTQAGMLECKKALVESDGDMEKAAEFLRKKGLSAANKRAGRQAKEGVIISRIKKDGKYGILFELACETDFVSKNDKFRKIAEDCADLVEKGGLSIDSADKLPAEGKEMIQSFVATTGENTMAGKIVQFAVEGNGVLASYLHSNNKIAVLVELGTASADAAKKAEVAELGKEIAMQAAAAAPLYLNSTQVPAELVAKEKEIYLEQMKDSGKPANVLEKILDGKIKKYYTEVCLLDQPYIKDGAKSVTDVIKEYSTKAGSEITVKRFARVQIGA